MTFAAVLQRSQTEREAWKYTSLKDWAAVAFAQAMPFAVPVAPMVRTASLPPFHRLVFVNGVWDAAASQLNDLPNTVMQGDPQQGYRLTLAGQTCLVTAPIELLFINKAEARPVEAATNLRIALGESGRLTLIERHLGAGEDLFAHVLATEIELEPQAKLVHGKIVHGDASTVHLARTRVRADRGAYYDNFALLCGGKLVRNEIDVTLADEMAQSRLNGLMLLREGDHADTTTRLTHAAPHGTSRQFYKSVVSEKAKAVFQGKIVVAEGAQKTDGHQLSRALLLSDRAEMDAKPELEIYADDVKCSHGSTVGDLDEQAMFYLRSRGIGEAEARTLLIEAFVTELVDNIQVSELRRAVRNEVSEWLR